MLGLMDLLMWLSGAPGPPGSSCTLQSSSPGGAWHSEFQRGEMQSQDERKRARTGAASMCNLNLSAHQGSKGLRREPREAGAQARWHPTG